MHDRNKPGVKDLLGDVNKSRNINNDNDGQTVTITDNKIVLQALALINDCNKYKMELTTNSVVLLIYQVRNDSENNPMVSLGRCRQTLWITIGC